MTRRLIIGISGASGIIYGIRLLEILKQFDIETHLVVSKAAERTRALETDLTAKQLQELADVTYASTDFAASIASGSFKTMGMIVAPCSVKTVAEIAQGVTSSLLTRAADVVLKERRRLVLMVRESPLHAGHLRNMLLATEMGAIIAPPLPAFYVNPISIDQMIQQTLGRVLDLFEIDTGFQRWGESN